MKHNMKIQINAEQPLDEVVKELEMLGYDESGCLVDLEGSYIVTINGLYTWSLREHISLYDPLPITITLQQLREMK